MHCKIPIFLSQKKNETWEEDQLVIDAAPEIFNA